MSTTPPFEEAIAAIIDGHTSEWHTGLPGRVTAYDPASQTATVEIVVDAYDPETGAAARRPVIPRVPVMFPSGGGFRFVFDLEAGDPVWVQFASRSLDEWRRAKTVPALPRSRRRFALSDAVALPAFSSTEQPTVEIRSQGGKLYIGSASVDIVGELKNLADIVADVAAAVPAPPQQTAAEALALRVSALVE